MTSQRTRPAPRDRAEEDAGNVSFAETERAHGPRAGAFVRAETGSRRRRASGGAPLGGARGVGTSVRERAEEPSGRPLRVAYVITRGDSVGGAQKHVVEVSAAVKRAGHEVKVFFGADGRTTESIAPLLDEVGVAYTILPRLVRRISPGNDLGAVLDLARELRAFRPDLLSCHSSKAGIVGRLAAAFVGVPAIFTAHGWAFGEGRSRGRNFVYRTLERAMSRLSRKIICVSHHDREIGVAAGIDESKLVAVHNGRKRTSDPEPRTGDPGTERGAGPVRVVMVGRLAPQKDYDTFLRGASVPGAALSIVGDGPMNEEIRSLAGQLGLEDRVTFHGYSQDVAGHLKRSDVFVLCSHWEGFPRSTLEAMRAGLPTIVTDVGGSREAVVEGVTGYVIPPRSPEVLWERLQRLTDSELLRRRMGRAARQRFLEHFTLERMLQETFHVYTETLGIEKTTFPVGEGVADAEAIIQYT